MLKKSTLSLIVAIPVFLYPAISFAGTGLSIQPIKVSETVNRGGSVSGSILLSNASSEDVRVDLKVEDFIPIAGAEGIQFVGRAPGVTTVRDWINFADGVKAFDFKEKESRQIPYTISIPKDAEPGSHFGVLFFKATKLSDINAQIKVGTQVGVLVFITVPGNYQQTGKILDFSAPNFVIAGHENIQFMMKFENTGTVHFEPKGSIDIFNMFGSKVVSIPISGQVVLPTGIKDLSFGWLPTSLLFGHYKAVASVYDGANNLITSNTVSFYALPVWYILSFIISVLALFFIIKFFKSKVKISINLK